MSYLPIVSSHDQAYYVYFTPKLPHTHYQRL